MRDTLVSALRGLREMGLSSKDIARSRWADVTWKPLGVGGLLLDRPARTREFLLVLRRWTAPRASSMELVSAFPAASEPMPEFVVDALAHWYGGGTERVLDDSTVEAMGRYAIFQLADRRTTDDAAWREALRAALVMCGVPPRDGDKGILRRFKAWTDANPDMPAPGRRTGRRGPIPVGSRPDDFELLHLVFLWQQHMIETGEYVEGTARQYASVVRSFARELIKRDGDGPYSATSVDQIFAGHPTAPRRRWALFRAFAAEHEMALPMPH